MLGRPVTGSEYVLLNRNLFKEYGALIASSKWDVAFLQECPPRWGRRLANAAGAQEKVALTSRNWLRPVMSPVARFRPHLPGSWEGGSNLTLVRNEQPGSTIRGFEIKRLTWQPERRVVSLTWLQNGLCLANLHASTGQKNGERDVLAAAEYVVSRAEDRPLVFGGDFNIRPRKSELFSELTRRFGFSAPTDSGSIDHLLVRNAEIIEQTIAWPPARRDVPDVGSDLMVRLSDHAPVVSSIRL